MEVSRANIIAVARETVGTPWRHQGRTLRGIDCVGVIVYTGRNTNSFDYDWTEYRRKSQYPEIFKQFSDPDKVGATVIGKNEARPGDIILLKDKVYPCHCGIIGVRADGTWTLINARYLDKVYEERMTEVHKFSTMGAFRFPGVVD